MTPALSVLRLVRSFLLSRLVDGQELPISIVLVLFNLDADLGKAIDCCAEFRFNVKKSVELNTTFLAYPVELVHQANERNFWQSQVVPTHVELKRRLGHRLVVCDCSIAQSSVFFYQTDVSQLVKKGIILGEIVSLSVAVLDGQTVLIKFFISTEQGADFDRRISQLNKDVKVREAAPSLLVPELKKRR